MKTRKFEIITCPKCGETIELGKDTYNSLLSEIENEELEKRVKSNAYNEFYSENDSKFEDEETEFKVVKKKKFFIPFSYYLL